MKTYTVLAALVAMSPNFVSAQGVPGGHFIENWDLNQDATVSLEEITMRRADVFYMFDVDENGVLDAAEYASFDETRAADMAGNGHEMGQGANRVQDGLTMAFNDLDSDQTVTEDEFVMQSQAWLIQIDRNGDGVVTSLDFGPDR